MEVQVEAGPRVGQADAEMTQAVDQILEAGNGAQPDSQANLEKPVSTGSSDVTSGRADQVSML